MGKKTEKTNVMRILDRCGVGYNSYDYSFTAALSGTEVAAALGKDPACTFKTLVTQGASKAYYVFMVPVADELDLKKAARAAGEKSIAMIKSKDLLPLTGYIHGGCSPIGMKKQFRTFIHETTARFDAILFSAGKIGYQVEMPLSGLQKVVPVTPADIIV